MLFMIVNGCVVHDDEWLTVVHDSGYLTVVLSSGWLTVVHGSGGVTVVHGRLHTVTKGPRSIINYIEHAVASCQPCPAQI